MPGILFSVYDPADLTIESRWQMGLQLVRHHPDHELEQYSEPGFLLACLYHPEVCQAPHIMVTEHHVLACYGNIYEDDMESMHDGEPLCRALLGRFLSRGVDGLKHLNGRYDIAVWERSKRVLHFVSDRFGANRHYALQRTGALHVACEVKALAAFLDRIEIDPAGLASMLSFGYHLGDLTILKDVKCLPNARHLEYCAADDRLSIDRYWSYPYGALEPLPGSEAELAAQLHDHLLTALKRQLRGVKKILLPISGGLDSRTMAGLLAQSSFTGEVLAYSFGQASSRDVRYGRAIASKLGYRHVTIPTPRDFMTRHLEQAAWRFDAEWSGELNWGPRFSHTHPALGDTGGCVVLSGMYGDIILGSDKFGYQQRAGDAPISQAQLRDFFVKIHCEYGPMVHATNLIQVTERKEVSEHILRIVNTTLGPISNLIPFYALMRAEFEHRQHRHTATVVQSIEYDLPAITPFLDTNLIDFCIRIPYNYFCGEKLYKSMIGLMLSAVATIPEDETGLPLSDSPVRAALHWRWARILAHIPILKRFFSRRAVSFDFQSGIQNQKRFFDSQASALIFLSPPLDADSALGRYHRLLDGNLTPADQVCAFLPPALFLRELNRRLSEEGDVPKRVS
ncbi:MAG: asparagine synthase-related protein [Sulfurimicrobium sp.]|nr:asparagine synthase-related protein [Sulfurimicrobium sp.]